MASEDTQAIAASAGHQSAEPVPLPDLTDYPSHIRFKPPPLILTPRLLLRPASEKDIPAIHGFLTQEDTMKFMMTKVSHSMADSERWFRSRFVKDPVTGRGGEGFIYMICLRDGDAEGLPIGTTGSRQVPYLGYQIGIGAKYWGKGYGGEAVKAIVNGICETIQAEKQERWDEAYVQIEVDNDNIGSIKVAEKIGAKKFGEGAEADDGKPFIIYRCYVKDWISSSSSSSSSSS